MIPPAVLETTFMEWYYQILPLLNVNHNTTSNWRWLLHVLQGLGLPNMGIEKLSSMLQYFTCHWDCGRPMSFQLRRSVELLQVECGLEGNPLVRDIRLYRCLATNTWIKMLWHYPDYYQVRREVDHLIIPLLREQDRVLMEIIVCTFPPEEWLQINRVRHYQRIYFMS